MTSGVVVVGSLNMDLSISTPRLPGAGETVLGTGVARGAGGKGANQAVAAARAGGASTMLIGRVGDDADGVALVSALRRAGVNTSMVATVGDATTGLAVIAVDAAGENSIIVVPGANARLALSTEERQAVREAAVLLVQCEVPEPAILAAAEAKGVGTRLVLNAAPAQAVSDAVLQHVDLLVVNEHEAIELAGRSDLDTALETLLTLVPSVIVTLGAKGSRLVRRNGSHVDVVPPAVDAIDTVAAGDTFCGVLAAALSRGRTELEAMGWGTVAAALAVQRRGAQASIPQEREVARLYAESLADAEEPGRG